MATELLTTGIKHDSEKTIPSCAAQVAMVTALVSMVTTLNLHDLYDWQFQQQAHYQGSLLQ